jgi:hypothetical protein
VPRDCQPAPAGPDEGEPAAETPAAETVTSETATSEADAAGTGKRDGLAALESMLAGAELLMVGCGEEEEEAW